MPPPPSWTCRGRRRRRRCRSATARAARRAGEEGEEGEELEGTAHAASMAQASLRVHRPGAIRGRLHRWRGDRGGERPAPWGLASAAGRSRGPRCRTASVRRRWAPSCRRRSACRCPCCAAGVVRLAPGPLSGAERGGRRGAAGLLDGGRMLLISSMLSEAVIVTAFSLLSKITRSTAVLGTPSMPAMRLHVGELLLDLGEGVVGAVGVVHAERHDEGEAGGEVERAGDALQAGHAGDRVGRGRLSCGETVPANHTCLLWSAWASTSLRPPSRTERRCRAMRSRTGGVPVLADDGEGVVVDGVTEGVAPLEP
jgi:hypothetical protein